LIRWGGTSAFAFRMQKRNRRLADRSPARRAAPVGPSLSRRSVVIAVLLAAGLGTVLAAAIYGGPARWLWSPPEVPPPAAAGLEIPRRPQFPPPSESTPGSATVAALRDEAFDVAERVAKALPDSPRALCLLGSVHHRYSAESVAIDLWRRCLDLDPRFAEAHHSLGLLANSAGDFAVAEEHLQAALRINPTWAEVPLPLAQALLGQNKLRETVALLEPFVQANPASAQGWCRLGQAYHQSGDYENARRCHLAAVEADPQLADARHGAALALEKLGQAEQARRHFEELRKLRGEEQRTARVAQKSLTDEGRVRETAVAMCLAAARVWLLHGQAQEAERLWRRAAELGPRDRESRHSLCMFYAQQQRWAEALPFHKELCDLAPDDPQQWLSLGVLYGKIDQPNEAESALRRAIAIAPDLADCHAALAEVQMLPGRDVQEAVSLAAKAVALAPTARHHYVLSAARWNSGDAAGARSALEEAMRLDPGEREYREAYARLAFESR
jgi:tetratricopeptide (TPR) repeat protein